MIHLSHLRQCSSVLEQQSVSHERLPFYVDTRKYQHPGALVAIPGAKVNPLDVMENILKQSCPLVVYQKNEINDEKVAKLQDSYNKTVFLPVTDSVTFLQELTSLHIREWQAASPRNTVFAISGSNGKTTHKEMLSHILKEIVPGKIVATEKNNNNHLGVPLTILDVKPETECLVLELGSNHPGEIKVLCDIAAPNAGLTTNIGATHLEFFGDEAAVFKEEGYLYYAVKERTLGRGFFLINADDPFLSKLPPTSGSVTYGESDKAQARIEFHANGAGIHFSGKALSAHNSQITGKHNKLNLITCAFIARNFYPELEKQIVAAAASFTPTKNRSQWMSFEGKSVFLDAYNANPSSMKAALQGFKEAILSQGKKLEEACVVLGDMNELGDSTPSYHQDVGAFVKSLGFQHVFFVGRFSQFYLQGFPEANGRATTAAFKQEYREQCLKEYSVHFIKGSRSLQLESLFDIT